MTTQQNRSNPASTKSDVPTSERVFPVIGIGASAGGLDAFKSLLDALPDDTGMAFVLIQHLDPLHASLMADLLAVHTTMPVTQAADGVVIHPNRIYLIPPGVSLAIVNGKLRLSDPIERHGARKAFDFFLRSLAEAQGSRSACVVLSGTGTDGSEGLKAVREAGGFVIVQEPSEAAFDGMPQSAIQTGKADLVLPVADIPDALIHHFGNPSARRVTAEPGPSGELESALAAILDLVQGKTGQDFSLYKTGTLTRRIERRMAMAGVTDPAKYVAQLRADAAEVDQLAQDLLINVTHFFRDPDAFDTLAESVIPELIRSQPSDDPLRVWAPGCSTGEEVYSLTILFIEAIAASKRNLKLQVFASDVDTQAVSFARAGLYGPETANQISAERLGRFFTREGESYRVTRTLREAVVFTIQDLLADPPFSRLDFISCRNVLIYLRPDAQEQILSLFHFALRAGGVLFLGRSETAGRFSERFEPISKKQRIYRHVVESRPGEVNFGARHGHGKLGLKTPPALRAMRQRTNLEDLATKLAVHVFAPPSVLVDEKYEPLFYSGDVDRFLQLAPGEANRNILIMARHGLRPALRTALDTARDTKELAWKAGGKLKRKDGAQTGVKIGVQPIPAEGMFLVSFIEEPGRLPPAAEANTLPEDSSRVFQLEQELDETRNELNAAIRDLELSNEELRAANEEALSTNEEFQSTNEELETSKEELQSLNEELTALNAQLHETLEQQRATAADLQNILNSSDVATLFLDRNLNIRFFTPAAKALFGAIGTDIGRPLTDLAQRFEDDALIRDAHAVLADGEPVRREIESHDGEWYNRSILPYRINAGRVEGVVVTFAGISEMKAAERTIEAEKAFAEGVITTVKQPLAVLDKDLCLISASPSFFRAFGINAQDCIGKPFTLAGPREAEILTGVLAPIQRGEPIEDLELAIDLGAPGERTLQLSAREIAVGSVSDRKILVSIDDVTEARAKTDALAAARDEAEHANRLKSNFLAAASHDLRQPLQTMNLLLGMLGDAATDPSSSKLLGRIDDTIASMSSLLDKLLDINQLEAGVVSPRPDDFEINDMLAQLNSEFGIHATKDGLRLRFVPCHLTVRTDPRLLEQILRNMISNAIKYTGRGRILLGARRRGDRLRIEVWDTGTGIPEEKLALIFKEGHQLRNRIPRRARGLGLGLSIVQRLADLLGLPVTVRSWVGHGSVFSVEVPIVDGPARIPAHYQRPASQRLQGRSSRALKQSSAILVLEDDAELRDTLRLLLESQGFPAVAAADEREALAVAAKGSPRIDFVVADFNLPGASGLEVIEKLEEALGRKLPGIFLTGDISAATLVEIASKKYLHLYKPIEAAVLVGHIERALRAIQRKAKAEKILVVDDDSEFCEAMRDTLEMHGFEADIFTDASALLAADDLTKARCVIADVHMPGMSGLELAGHLAEIAPSLPVIVVTGYGDVATAVEAIKSGAFDFLEKPIQPDELIERIERALNSTGQQHELLAEKEKAVARMAKLTTRQREILDLVLKGAPSKNIAADLNISQRTVENHRAAIMRKFGVHSIPGLVRIALAAQSQ